MEEVYPLQREAHFSGLKESHKELTVSIVLNVVINCYYFHFNIRIGTGSLERHLNLKWKAGYS